MSRNVFVLLDGDRVGDSIDGHYLRNDVVQLSAFGRQLDGAVAALAAAIREVGGAVHLAGGDNVLGSLPDLDAFFRHYARLVPSLPVTFSVGIGEDARQAHLALKVAKASGFGSIVRTESNDRGLHFSRRAEDGRWVDA